MKRLLHVVAVAAVAVFIPMAVSAPTHALECEMSNTGPESENTCSVEETYTCTIDNDNNVTIKDSNDQTVGSGGVTVDESGNGGGAVSGAASNDNGTSFNVEITNGESCAVAPVVSTPETPETPEQPGKGESPAPVQPAQNVTPKALPVTSGGQLPVVLLSATGVATVVGIALAYRRLAL